MNNVSLADAKVLYELGKITESEFLCVLNAKQLEAKDAIESICNGGEGVYSDSLLTTAQILYGLGGITDTEYQIVANYKEAEIRQAIADDKKIETDYEGKTDIKMV